MGYTVRMSIDPKVQKLLDYLKTIEALTSDEWAKSVARDALREFHKQEK